MKLYNPDFPYCTETDCAGYKECFRALKEENEKEAAKADQALVVFAWKRECWKQKESHEPKQT